MQPLVILVNLAHLNVVVAISHLLIMLLGERINVIRWRQDVEEGGRPVQTLNLMNVPPVRSEKTGRRVWGQNNWGMTLCNEEFAEFDLLPQISAAKPFRQIHQVQHIILPLK